MELEGGGSPLEMKNYVNAELEAYGGTLTDDAITQDTVFHRPPRDTSHRHDFNACDGEGINVDSSSQVACRSVQKLGRLPPSRTLCKV